MKRPAKLKTQFFGKRPRLVLTTVAVACVVLVIGAMTVLSRGKAQPAVTTSATESGKTRAHGQDQHLHREARDAQPQELTSEEAQKLGAGLRDMVNQSTEGLGEIKHDDGSVSLDLQGRFQSVTVARINKDGSITHSCVDNPQAAAAFFGIDAKLIDPNIESSDAKQTTVKHSKFQN